MYILKYLMKTNENEGMVRREMIMISVLDPMKKSNPLMLAEIMGKFCDNLWPKELSGMWCKCIRRISPNCTQLLFRLSVLVLHDCY